MTETATHTPHSVRTGQTLPHGVEFDSELAGPDGASFILYREPHHTDEQIREAKDECRARYDVVRLRVQSVRADAMEPPHEDAAERPEGEPLPFVDSCREIVRTHSARKVDRNTGALLPENRRGGILIDAFSASAVVAVHDALNEKNAAKLRSMHPAVAVHICFSAMNRK